MSGRVVVLGATGLVGRTVLRLLEEREFPAREVRLLAGPSTDARTISFRGRAVPVTPVTRESFADAELAKCNAAAPQESEPALAEVK